MPSFSPRGVNSKTPSAASAAQPDDDSSGDATSVPFHITLIEGVALKGLPRAPGTVLVASSDGERHKSWWQLALDRDD